MEILDAILAQIKELLLFPRKHYGEMEMTVMSQSITKIIDMQSTYSFSTDDINGI